MSDGSAVAKAPPRARIFYLDLVRALATLIIVLTHFNNPYLTQQGYLLTNTPFGIYVGGLGVSLFLIISGAALTYTYGGRGRLDLRRFYWKRFKGIYPMYWIAWVGAVLYYFVDTKGFPPITAPLRNVVFTVIGMDGLLANFQVPTTYLLGEWFLGFIVLFYLVFPLLLWGVERFPVATAAVVMGGYALSLWYFYTHPGLPSAVILPTRLPELVFGMLFVKYVRRVHWAVVLPAMAVMAVSAQLPTQVPEDLATTFVGISAFLCLVVAGRFVAIAPVREGVALVAKYSYPIFLVHHVVIMELYAKIDTTGFLLTQRVVMLAAVCALTFLLALALDRVSNAVVAFCSRCFQGRWWVAQVAPTER
ncbi:acyltransferase family protein [Actinomyces weissii]|uniref:Acyltransferase n=1 Tax=Actinomyces weissii TaxID=675090 RepID=A0A7T7S190_9ACTO|nr:acyltransferase [Actinomyces weissii]QQM67003.1 acyltransferase [Actinomyces weissii]